jgi:hypothetical protein
MSLNLFAEAAKDIVDKKLMNVIAISLAISLSEGRVPRALAQESTATSRLPKQSIFDVHLADAERNLLNAGFALGEVHTLRDALGGRLSDLNMARIVESYNNHELN